MLSSAEPVTVEEVIPPVPVTLTMRMPPSSTASPLLEMFMNDRLRFFVLVARMPLSLEC